MGNRTTQRLVAGAVVGAIATATFGFFLAGPVAGAQDTTSFGIPADDARRIVQEILDDPRFTARQDETIFTRLGRALTGFVQRIIGWLNRVVLGVGDDSTSGRFLFWTIVTIVIVIIAAIVASRLAKRRSAAAIASRQQQEADHTAISARDLERQAELALAEGRNEDAVRLFYRAGLIQLGDRGIIEYRSSLTSGEVADTLRLAVFDHIAGTFDSIAYGHRKAEPEDAATSRHEWEDLLGRAPQ